MKPLQRIPLRLLPLALCTTVACESPAPTKAELATGDQVVVADLTKGDELSVTKDGGTAAARMLGIHSFSPTAQLPAVKKHGEQSAAYVRKALVGSTVTVTLGKTAKDDHGRFLVYVDKGGKDQNLHLVETGNAVVYTEYGFGREVAYLKAEGDARAGKKGMWGDDEAVALIRSLRGMWAETRKQRDGTVANDELIAEAKPDQPAPPAAK